MKHWTALAAAGFIAAAAFVPANAADISGAGATFPYPIYAKWADAYKKETGNGLNYQSIGSGGGIKQIKAKTVTFGASDAPLSGKDLDETGLVQFPMVMGGIVPVVNLEGIKPGESDDRWPDARQDLPRRDQDLGRSGDQEAQPERQAAESGDRDRASVGRFRHDLQFRLLPGGSEPGLEVEGRRQHLGAVAVGIGAKGNEGVANNVAQTKGSIGYVEYAYAKQNKLTFTKMVNKAGKTVAPTSEAFQAAAANADWKSKPGYGVMLAEPARREVLADDGADMDPDVQEAGRSGGYRRGAQVLRLGLQEGWQDGRRPRLRPDAGECRSRTSRSTGGARSRTRAASPLFAMTN